METLPKKTREKSYTRGDFELSIKQDEVHLLIEACNSRTFTYYSSFMSNKNIEEVTQHLFSNIEEFYDVLTTALDSKATSKPNGIYVKFNKKEVYIFMKVEFALPIKKTSSFYIYLKPQGLGAPTKKIHSQMDELEKKVKTLEKIIEENPIPKGFKEKIKKIEYFLEKNNVKQVTFNEEATIFKLTKQPTIASNGKLKKERKKSADSLEIIETTKLISSKLIFDSKINTKYFKFKENDCKISRSAQDKKMHFLAWGIIPFDKKSTKTQFFEVKIEKVNPECELINACIGIMIDDGSKKLFNLADHNGEGCYLYGVSNQFFWINDVKTKTHHRYGKTGDLIRVMVNFVTRKILWIVNQVEIWQGEIQHDQIGEFEFFPVVTLALNKETVKLSGYFNE